MPRFDASFTGFYCLDLLGVPVSGIPEGGQCHFIDRIRMTVAGTAGGTVIDAARLGLDCLALGAVGDDEKADFMLATLERNRVDISCMQRHEGVQTSASIIPVRPNGERPALHVRGVSDHFHVTPEALEKALDARVVHFGGTGMLGKMDGEPTRAFLKAAKKAGRITTFDLIQANEETLSLVEPLLPFIDYFMPSIDEASVMTGLDDPGACADFFFERGVGVCALSMGAEGALIAERGGRRFHMPAFEVEVVDTTGCGDAFSAGFIAGLVRDYDLEECARLASACGALTATGLGSDGGIRSWAQTLEALESMTPLSRERP